MSETYYQALPDSTGDKFRTVQKTINSQIVQEEVLILDADMKRLITGKYILSSGVIAGSATNPYTYVSLFNPVGSGKIAAVKKWYPIYWAVAAAVYVEFATWRVSAASGGTQIAVANIPKKDTTDANASLIPRTTEVTITTVNKLLSQITAGAVAQFPYLGTDLRFNTGDDIILREGEGLALQQVAVGSTAFRVVVLMEWDEFTGAPRL